MTDPTGLFRATLSREREMGDRKPFFIAVFSSILLLSSSLILVESGGSYSGSRGRRAESEWQILTKRNFSSQIRRHPHILLIVTVPWSGESRSLMKEVAKLVADKQEELGYLKLMVIYRNSEKMLADVLGAVEGITLFYYHHSTSYKYQGRLRAQNILSSVYHFMYLQFEEVPLKSLHTQEDLENFVETTDKAILLLEFCGWSAKLLQQKNNEDHETSPPLQNRLDNVGIFGENLTREAGGKLTFDKKKNQKDFENEELTCGNENGLAGSTWLGGFTWANQSDSQGIEYGSAGTEMSCTPEEFQRFESFFLKFTKIARENFLPPERQRFGLISERSLLPFLGVVNPETWLLMLQFSGCTNCSMILEEGDDLKTILQTHHSLVMELDVDGHNLESSFPADRPSVILFVDRSSDSSKLRGESRSALQVLRKFAWDNQRSYQMVRGPDNSNSMSSSAQALFETWSQSISDPLGHQTPTDSMAPKIVKIKDNMALMIINKGESISPDTAASDTQQNTGYDILTHLLGQEKPALRTKETKISLLAKEVGFQLLSDDFEVQVVDSFPSHKGNDQFNGMIKRTVLNLKKETSKLPEGSNENHVNLNNRVLLEPNCIASVDNGKQPELTDTETGLQQNQEAVPCTESNSNEFTATFTKELKDDIGTSKSTQINEDYKSFKQEDMGSLTYSAENSFHLENELPIVEKSVEKEHVDHTACSLNETCSNGAGQNLAHVISSEAFVEHDAAEVIKSIKASMLVEPHVQHLPFLGSFFFSDGGYQLLRSLTGGAKIPSLVMLDPVLQQHYVFSEETDISYSSLVNFVDKFLNGSLTPYRYSASSIINSREAPQPPFVNLDFHEADSIPRVTANTFCELIIGYKPCEMGNDISPSHIQKFRSVWKMDVLVLFSSSWCGFCQRMELIVREVYRAFKSFTTMLKSESKNMDPMHIQDMTEDPMLNELPSIFLMDCTLNDCGSFLKPMGKREIYPSLLLFPAENKNAITYEGDMSVVNIIEFLESHGRNSHYLNRHKGFLWTHTWKGNKRRGTLHDISSSVHEEATYTENKYNELLLGTAARGDNHHPVGSHTSNNFQNEDQHIVAGSVLAATDKLFNAFPFDNSTVLIVSVDENQGFQGIIINKRISWAIVFKELDKDLEPLKQAPLFYGGPVRAHDLPLVSLAQKAMEGYRKVSAHIYFGNPLATSLSIEGIKTGDRFAYDYWFFLGYSSWEWNQLFDELEGGAWHLSSSPVGHLVWPDR